MADTSLTLSILRIKVSPFTQALSTPITAHIYFWVVTQKSLWATLVTISCRRFTFATSFFLKHIDIIMVAPTALYGTISIFIIVAVLAISSCFLLSSEVQSMQKYYPAPTDTPTDICASNDWVSDIVLKFRSFEPYESLPMIKAAHLDPESLQSELQNSESAVKLIIRDSISFDESVKYWNLLKHGSLYIQKVDDIQSIETVARYLLLTQWWHAVFHYNLQQQGLERMFVGDVLCSKCGCIIQRELNDPKQVDGIENREGEFYRIAKTTKTDKVTKHKYHILYDKTMQNYYHRNKGIFMEIGFGCGMAYGAGESAKIWTKLFNEIHFVEYNGECIEKHKQSINAANYTVHVGDQADVIFLEQIKSEYFLKHHHGVDIIIDDGGHWNHQIIKSFGSLWPMVNPNGLYYIEDCGESAYDKNYVDSLPVTAFGTEKPGTAAYFISNLLYNLFCRVTGKSCYDIGSIEARLDIALIRKMENPVNRR